MNSELYGKNFRVPPEVLQHIQAALTSNPQGDGVKRAKFLLKNGVVTYQAMKRLKNFFDNFNGQPLQQYQLAGGDGMKSFIEKTLGSERDAVELGKKVRQDATVDPYLGNKPQQIPNLNEEVEEEREKNQNAVAVIVNEDNQILLLKRADSPDIWQPGKYALVGGAVEHGESPEEAVKREIREETGLNIDKFKGKFKIGRANSDSEESIFLAKYDGDPFDIKLNFEHTRYGWYGPEEIHFLNTVPYLMEYINMVFKKEE